MSHKRTVQGAAVTWYIHPDGSSRTARLGDTIEVSAGDVERFDRFEKQEITAGYIEDSLPVLPGAEPARAGRGSSRQAWVDYADSVSLEYPESATRDEIIALLDERNSPASVPDLEV